VELDKSNAEAWAHISVAYGKGTQYEESIKAGEKAVALNPDSAIAHYNLAMAYYFTRQFDLALQHLETAKHLGFADRDGVLEKVRQEMKGGRKKESRLK
jgi:tetratricopeptide (TPR) repeat protein